MQIIKPVGEYEIKQMKALKARYEENKLEIEIKKTLGEMPGAIREKLINNYKSQWSNFKNELINIMPEIQLKAFVYQSLLSANKEKYPNLYNEYKQSVR